jgi:hypothetical protein
MQGVFLTAAELTHRGFVVSLTARNAFGADLLVTDNQCEPKPCIAPHSAVIPLFAQKSAGEVPYNDPLTQPIHLGDRDLRCQPRVYQREAEAFEVFRVARYDGESVLKGCSRNHAVRDAKRKSRKFLLSFQHAPALGD